MRRWLDLGVRTDALDELACVLVLVALEVHLDHRQPGVDPPELVAAEAEQLGGLFDGTRRSLPASTSSPSFAATNAATPRFRTSSATG